MYLGDGLDILKDPLTYWIVHIASSSVLSEYLPVLKEQSWKRNLCSTLTFITSKRPSINICSPTETTTLCATITIIISFFPLLISFRSSSKRLLRHGAVSESISYSKHVFFLPTIPLKIEWLISNSYTVIRFLPLSISSLKAV